MSAYNKSPNRPDRNAEIIAKIERGYEDIKAGKGVSFTMEELKDYIDRSPKSAKK